MIEIREARTADAPAIAGLIAELGHSFTDREAAEQLDRLAETGVDPVFVACDAERILGLAALHITQFLQHHRKSARITALVVTEAARGQNVGRSLVEHALSAAARAGCDTVELTTALGRADAHEFYRRVGFEATSYRFRKTIEG